jgi:hypothetical protein
VLAEALRVVLQGELQGVSPVAALAALVPGAVLEPVLHAVVFQGLALVVALVGARAAALVVARAAARAVELLAVS